MAPEPPTSELLFGWGRTAPTRATVHRPRALDEVVTRITSAGSRGVVARGLGRSYGDAAQNAGGDVVLCTDLDRVLDIDLDKGTVTAEAGVSLDTLLRVLLPLGWTVMAVPGTSYVTVGGAIASDIHGKFRHGSFADFVESMRVVTPAHGATTLTPDGTPDAFWATAGGMGLTGVVTEATLRLHPVETAQIVCDTERAANVDDCMARMMENDHQYRYSVAWIDCMATGASMGRSVLSRGNHAPIDEIAPKKRAAARLYSPSTLLGTPPVMPNVINKLSVRAFNEMWFRKAPKQRLGHVEGIKPFFFPLDGVRGWNHVYGPGGFVQYQYVVPYGAEQVVRTTLERLSAVRTPTFLAVLKRFEHDSQSMLGFPISGWTLALDVPTGIPELGAMLDDLDELVANAGGRVYFTKDARLRPELVRDMYPRLEEWRAARGALDPDGRLRSDLDRRLNLSGLGKEGIVKDALGEVQSILVLGGTSEIGKAIAEKLVGERSAKVVLAVRRPGETSDRVDADLRRAGASHVTSTEFDATNFERYGADWIDMQFENVGDFDVVIVAFGVLGDQELTEHDAKAALEVVQTNFTATVAIGVPLVERMRKQGHGTIVFLSSVAGERVRRSNYTYGASKAGADGWFQGVAAGAAGSGVNVMIVRPGFVHTKMTEGLKAAPLSVTAEQVADAVVAGLKRRKEIVWVPGTMRYVMAILRHVPTVVFRRLPM